VKKTKNTRGLSLAEMAVSITVLAIAVLGTVTAVVAAANLARTTAETRRATRTSAALMDTVRATAFDQIVPTFGDSTYTFNDILGVDDDGSIRVAVEELDNGSDQWMVYKVTLNAEWNGMTGGESLEFVTYVADRAAASVSVNGGYVPPADPGMGGDNTGTTADTGTTGTMATTTADTGGTTSTTSPGNSGSSNGKKK
jgi:Tfp pilus assembly protein PilV